MLGFVVRGDISDSLTSSEDKLDLLKKMPDSAGWNWRATRRAPIDLGARQRQNGVQQAADTGAFGSFLKAKIHVTA